MSDTKPHFGESVYVSRSTVKSGKWPVVLHRHGYKETDPETVREVVQRDDCIAMFALGYEGVSV